MVKAILLLACMFLLKRDAQSQKDTLYSFRMFGDVIVTIDQPQPLHKKASTKIILYALPNGNSTAWTMGRKVKEGDDWHFDIQHIRAQTLFIRNMLPDENIVVAYLENDFKSWPAWKTKHTAYQKEVKHIVDTIFDLIQSPAKHLYMNGHSGGGRFIFSYLDAVDKIPQEVMRISFLDSNYGYDSTYTDKLKEWLKTDTKHVLNVFAYNDSVALYQGKPVVSATGGTWYRSRLMQRHFSKWFRLRQINEDSIITFFHPQVQFYYKPNHDKGIYHTQQVALNGFIHSIFSATPLSSKGYRYYGDIAYRKLIAD